MLASLTEIEGLLRCPSRPRIPVVLSRKDGRLASATANMPDGSVVNFPVTGEQPVLIDFSTSVIEATWADYTRSVVSGRRKWARTLKGNLFGTARLSRRNFSRFAGLIRQAATGESRPVVLMVGAATEGMGTEQLYDDSGICQIAFDIYASSVTQFVADAHEIPLADGCVDAVCVQAVMEHVLAPERVAAEIARVLKPDGLLYAETPFMQQVHEGAYDFTRFTELGHRWLWRDFEALDRGALGGPGLSLYWAVKYFFRGITRSRLAADLLSLPFGLAVFADILADRGNRIDGANGVYFLGRLKPGAATTASIASQYLGAQR